MERQTAQDREWHRDEPAHLPVTGQGSADAMNSMAMIVRIGAGVGLAVLFAFWIMRYRKSGHDVQGTSKRVLADDGGLPPVDLDYYPGEPAGYSGFTDHHAMMQSITDDLVDREADWQFRTLGSADGFLCRVLAAAAGKDDHPATIRVAAADVDDAAMVEWLARMQMEGTENASPSTSNLATAVRRIAMQIATDGACRAGYWSGTPDHGLERATDPAVLEALVKQMRSAERKGDELGGRARFIASDHKGSG